MAKRGGAAPAVGITRNVVAGLHKVAMTLRQDTWRGASRAGLSASQVQVLIILAGEPQLRANQIADRLGVTPASASDTLATLARKRLITRAVDPLDARAARFRLTRRGDLVARRAAGWSDYLAQSIDSLSPDEQQVLLVTFTKMIRQLQQDGRISVARMCVTCSYFRPNVHPGAAPHHCDFVDKPFGNRVLRLDCADHTEAPPTAREALWLRWSHTT